MPLIDLSSTEDVGNRSESCGWHALTVKDGNTDVNAIWKAFTDAKPCADKLTLIKVMSTCCPR